MNVTELIESVRKEVGDTESRMLWDDADIIRFLNEAEREACRRSRLLVDSEDTDICKITAGPSALFYDLHAKVLWVKRVKTPWSSIPLKKVSYRDLDLAIPGWQDSPASTPRVWIPNFQSKKIGIYPKPESSGDVTLTVIRLPKNDLTVGGSVPEIPEQYHLGLVWWAVYRCLSRDDAEGEDRKLGKMYFDRFAVDFGPPSSAQDEVWIHRENEWDEYEGVY